jgi:predicted metal-binding protein
VPDPQVTVMLCRGCCCGSERKHPSTDHDGQRAVLEAVASPAVRVRVVDCIDRCERSNVVLVRERLAPGRRRDTWFGGVHYRAHTSALAEWVDDGCPAELPADLARLRIPPR